MTDTYGNSRAERGHDGSGGTKPSRTSTLCHVWRPAVKELALLQQVPGSLREEAWAGCQQSLSLKISEGKEIQPRLPPFFAPVLPGPGREVRSMMGWRKLQGRGLVFPGALKREIFSALFAAADWVKGSYRTAWSVSSLSSCSCSYAYGQGTALRPHTSEQCWSLLAGL